MTRQPGTQKVSAHRGWSTTHAENSLAAFAAAYAAGADEIEFDVRHTADGIPVIVHDANTSRTSDTEAEVSEMTLAEFQAISLRSPLSGEPTPGHAPATLAQVLDLFGGRIGMNIHVSDRNPPATAFRLVAQLPWANGNPGVYFAGREDVLEQALRHAPRVHRACLVKQRRPDEMLLAARHYDCHRVQFFHDAVNTELLHRARELGLTSNLFYSDDPRRSLELYAMGVDTILTNDAGPLVRAIRSAPLANSEPGRLEQNPD